MAKGFARVAAGWALSTLTIGLLAVCLLGTRAVPAFALEDGGAPASGRGVEEIAREEGGGDRFDCSDFRSVNEAQQELLDGDPYGLDEDGNGIACDEEGDLAGASDPREGEEISLAGVVERQGEKADGTEVWGLAASDEVGYYLEGRQDWSSLEGETVTARGVLVGGSEANVLRVREVEVGRGPGPGRGRFPLVLLAGAAAGVLLAAVLLARRAAGR